ncbi:MAG: lipoprotein-releasing ABC transporter permease subunit, partial [Desulfosalsimonas sp.]
MAFEYFIGSRYLRSRQKTGFISFITVLSVAGVTVGVMALIIVISVMTGAESYFKTKILGVEPHIVIRSYDGAIKDYAGVIDSVKRRRQVESAVPFVETQAMLRSSGGMSGAILRGLDPAVEGAEIIGFSKSDLDKKLTAQAGDGGEPAMPGIILGKNLARSLGVRQGDTLYLISPRGMMSPSGHIPSMKRFKVSGLFESGFFEYDSSMAYIHMQTAQGLLKTGDAATGIGVRISDIYKAGRVADDISENLGYSYRTMDWMEMNRNFFSALKLEKTAMFVILTLIILVAAFNIASTLIMMVMSKIRDIAILKAMGATEKSIRKIFVFKGLVIGGLGTAFGTVLGIAGCFVLERYQFVDLPGDVYYFTTLPVQVQFLDIAGIVASAMAICFLATLYPARKASRL